jgi:hypothetical protein
MDRVLGALDACEGGGFSALHLQLRGLNGKRENENRKRTLS